MDRQTLEVNERKVPRIIVDNENRIRRQEIRESCGVLTIHEWVVRRRRECDERVTRMDAERFVKISKYNLPGGR